MPILSKELRRLLEKVIAGNGGARHIAESGAEQSLQRLGVGDNRPHSSLSPKEQVLRNQLRAHGRQLGNRLDLQRGTQTIDHLRQAVAYEHWHRLLFARFLAENDLLLHPDHGVALSLDEVKESALGLGRDWIEVASDYAQQMLLREVFRSDDPALQVPLPPEKRLVLEEKLNSLPKEIFLADDSLGWVYQYWQTDAKDKVNQSESKIGADQIAPVTQLFTEDYMVLFALENTLGAWWTARRSASDLPGYRWSYLRLIDDGTPAVGSYDGWPKTAKELRVIDPCMGSGHFLAFALPILARMRQAEENLSITDAISAVLNENLFGLELDPRCSQIAAFNLALTAWKLANRHFELPALNLACSGIGPQSSKEQWIRLGGEIAARGGMPSAVDLFGVDESLLSEPIKRTMESLYVLFSQAPVLGSLINPRTLPSDLFHADYKMVGPLLDAVLKASIASDDAHEQVIAAAGMAKAATLLAGRYTLVITNVPYLGAKRQDAQLRTFGELQHPRSKADLSTMMAERLFDLLDVGGTVSSVLPQNWTNLTSYKHFRGDLLHQYSLTYLIWLGPGAFESIGGHVVKPVLMAASKVLPTSTTVFLSIDAQALGDTSEKSEALRTSQFILNSQFGQLANPDGRITFAPGETGERLDKSAICPRGIVNGDGERWTIGFWEIPAISPSWRPLLTAPRRNDPFAGRSALINWSGQGDEMLRPSHGNEAFGRHGVAVSRMTDLKSTLYFGEMYDQNVAAIIPFLDSDLPALWAYCQSEEFGTAVRKLDQKVGVTPATLIKVEFDRMKWLDAAKGQSYPGPPESSDPTQWLFSGHPSRCDLPLQAAVARLVGYKWPRQTGSSFPGSSEIGPDGIEGDVASDGIAPLSPVAGIASAANRLRALLASAYGDSWSASKLADLLGGKESLESWLRNRFFSEHCQVFDQHQFIWHVWDGLNDGFHALVNYHMLDRGNLEKLIFSYLGDWLARQRQDVQNGLEGSDTRLAAAEHLQRELIELLDGEQP